MKTKYNTFAPLFPGFYGTVFEYNETYDIESYNQENKTDYNYDNFNWNYKDYESRIAGSFVNRLETELKQFIDLEIEFQQVISPKEYNFMNDSINVSVLVDLSELIKLIRGRREEAEKYFKEKYTSCSGFISFHSNDINDWLNEDYINEKPEHRIGALLDCLVSIEIDRDDIYYWCDSEYYIDFELREEVSDEPN